MPIGIPRVPYRAPGGERAWQWVDLWNALYRERIIYIGKTIDEEYSNMLLATMLYLDSIESSQKLFLYISSRGGDLTPSMAIYDTMKSLQSPVGTHCMGHAFDMAGYILSAGEKGSRSGMPLCKVLLQPPAGAARGQADDIRNEATELLRVQTYLYNELSKNTGQPIDRIYKDLFFKKRFTAQQAVDYGLIDRIVKPSRIKPSAAPSKVEQNTGLG